MISFRSILSGYGEELKNEEKSVFFFDEKENQLHYLQ